MSAVALPSNIAVLPVLRASTNFPTFTFASFNDNSGLVEKYYQSLRTRSIDDRSPESLQELSAHPLKKPLIPTRRLGMPSSQPGQMNANLVFKTSSPIEGSFNPQSHSVFIVRLGVNFSSCTAIELSLNHCAEITRKYGREN